MLNLESPSTTPHQEGWRAGYSSQKNEYTYAIEAVTGEIPPELTGTLFRNIPAMLDLHGVSVRHPFDGDGMIAAIGFEDGRAWFRNRYVQTEGYVAEQASQRFLYRGVFGTAKPGGWWANAGDVRLKNIANTNVVYWGGKLLALWEAAEPHCLNPDTLETIGLDDLDGLLKPGGAFSAHPRFDPAGRMVNFGLQTGLSTKLQIYEFDRSGALATTYQQVLPGFAFIHDFAITPNYCLFCQNPVGFNPLPFLLGLKGAGECVSFNPQQPTKIWAIPRHGGKEVRVFTAPLGFVFHHANAFETDTGLVLDSIAYASFPEVKPGQDFRDTDFRRLAPGLLWRLNLDLATGQVQRQQLFDRCCEFPALHPQRVGQSHRYVYLATAIVPEGNGPLQAITKLDVTTGQAQTWTAAPTGYVNEPAFVPRPGATAEDDGWLMTLVYESDRHTTDVVILSAANLAVVAKLHLPHHLPHGLHGSWTEHVFGKLEEK